MLTIVLSTRPDYWLSTSICKWALWGKQTPEFSSLYRQWTWIHYQTLTRYGIFATRERSVYVKEETFNNPAAITQLVYFPSLVFFGGWGGHCKRNQQNFMSLITKFVYCHNHIFFLHKITEFVSFSTLLSCGLHFWES